MLVQKPDMQQPARPSDWHEILYELQHLAYGRETGEFSQKFQVQMVMTFKPTPVSSREPLNTAQVNTAKARSLLREIVPPSGASFRTGRKPGWQPLSNGGVISHLEPATAAASWKARVCQAET